MCLNYFNTLSDLSWISELPWMESIWFQKRGVLEGVGLSETLVPYTSRNGEMSGAHWSCWVFFHSQQVLLHSKSCWTPLYLCFQAQTSHGRSRWDWKKILEKRDIQQPSLRSWYSRHSVRQGCERMEHRKIRDNSWFDQESIWSPYRGSKHPIFVLWDVESYICMAYWGYGSLQYKLLTFWSSKDLVRTHSVTEMFVNKWWSRLIGENVLYMSSVIGSCSVIVATVKRVIERRESNTP